MPRPLKKQLADSDVKFADVDDEDNESGYITSVNSKNVVFPTLELRKGVNCFNSLEKVVFLSDQFAPEPTLKSICKCSHCRDSSCKQPRCIPLHSFGLGVLTADCLPIALSKNDGSEFAMLHAGWKGLLSGVIESTLTSFTKSCSDVSAWIGPSISQKNYEVGNDLYESFIDKDDGSESNFIEKGNDKWLFSLHGEAKRILGKYDINVDVSSECTFESESLFSYRRDQTENRILSIIWRNE